MWHATEVSDEVVAEERSDRSVKGQHVDGGVAQVAAATGDLFQCADPDEFSDRSLRPITETPSSRCTSVLSSTGCWKTTSSTRQTVD